MDKNWRARLDKIIAMRGYTRKSLSKAAGLGETFLRDVIEAGRDPGVGKLNIVCELLGVPLETVLNGDDGFTARIRIVGSVSAGEAWTPVDDGDEFAEMIVGGSGEPGLKCAAIACAPCTDLATFLLGRRYQARAFSALPGSTASCSRRAESAT